MSTLPTPNHEVLAAGLAEQRPVSQLAQEIGLSYTYALKLAKRPDIVQRALELAGDRASKVRQDALREEAERLAFSDVTHYGVDELGRLTVDPEADPAVSRAVSSVKVKRRSYPDKNGGQVEETETEIKLWDKPKALQMLMQAEGMLKQVVQAPDGGPPVRQVFKLGDTEIAL